jgi:hypothetical protein
MQVNSKTFRESSSRRRDYFTRTFNWSIEQAFSKDAPDKSEPETLTEFFRIPISG